MNKRCHREHCVETLWLIKNSQQRSPCEKVEHPVTPIKEPCAWIPTGRVKRGAPNARTETYSMCEVDLMRTELDLWEMQLCIKEGRRERWNASWRRGMRQMSSCSSDFPQSTSSWKGKKKKVKSPLSAGVWHVCYVGFAFCLLDTQHLPI